MQSKLSIEFNFCGDTEYDNITYLLLLLLLLHKQKLLWHRPHSYRNKDTQSSMDTIKSLE